MKNIEVKILDNIYNYNEISKKMALAARITQGGEKIKSMDDLVKLYNKPHKDAFISSLCKLPHPTLQKFGSITIAITGASRRFLAKITRHQNEIKFMSGSLKYSDYGNDAMFVYPYEFYKGGKLIPELKEKYDKVCAESMKMYNELSGKIGVDSAGYLVPQGLRNVLIMTATPFQLKHIINQRICRRNSPEMRYISALMLLELVGKYDELFNDVGAFCQTGGCKEGKMSCKEVQNYNFNDIKSIYDFIEVEFKELYDEEALL